MSYFSLSKWERDKLLDILREMPKANERKKIKLGDKEHVVPSLYESAQEWAKDPRDKFLIYISPDDSVILDMALWEVTEIQ